MSGQPMVDIAYTILKDEKTVMFFIDLWKHVGEIKNLSESQKENDIAEFFTDLSLDDRFVNMGGNQWDLSERHKLEEVKKVKAEDFIDEEEVEMDE